jgi:hypothetical protein
MTDLSASAITARLREVSRATSLASERRLDYKLDLSPTGVTRRLRKVEALRRFCLELARIGEQNGLRSTTRRG